jgi:zinc/manganese transport system substrate-binding protein
MRRCVALCAILLSHPARAAPPQVVAAETVYADIVRQIGGPAVPVTAILDNPAQDPHLFEATASVARALAHASLVIYNGAGYDPWMVGLLAATEAGHRRVIDIAALVHAPTGSNPHLWYAPTTMPVLAQAVAQALTQADPANAARYGQNLAIVQSSLAALSARIATLRTRHAGQPVTATEPVFGLMVAALGLQDRNQSFQRAVMNDTEPSAAEVAAIESDLRLHRVRALLRNIQTEDDTTSRLVRIARQSGVPVVGVSETEPPHTQYQAWVGAQLTALDRALGPA